MRPGPHQRNSARRRRHLFRAAVRRGLAGTALSTLLLHCTLSWAQSAEDVSPLRPGDAAPLDARFQTLDGKETTLESLIADAPAALVFFRGGW